jgi:hypothetical protein
MVKLFEFIEVLRVEIIGVELATGSTLDLVVVLLNKSLRQ